MQTHDFCVEIV